MAEPYSYVQSFSFTGYQATNPEKPLPGPRIDTEFANIEQAIGETDAALADIRRSDGALQNGIVTVESLDPGMALGILPPSVWATATEYKPPQSVWNGNKLYQCLVNHISGTFADDLASGYWNLVVDFDPPIDEAEAWADAAEISAAQAADSATTSTTHANESLTHSLNSASSAQESDNSATSAFNSMTQSSGFATNSANSATTATNEANRAKAEADRAQGIANTMLPDAPSNGTSYGRLNAAWSPVVAASAYTAADVLAKITTVDGAGSGLDADLLDGQQGAFYAPINAPVFTGDPRAPTPATADADTSIATTAFVHAVADPKLSDAPSDGVTYGRKDGAWAATSAGLPEAPSNGFLYARLNAGWATSGTFNGAITVNGVITANQSFQSSTAVAMLGTTGAGTVYARPNGVASAAGQTSWNSVGNQVTDGDIYSANGVFGTTLAGGNAYLAGGGGSANIILRPAGASNTTNQGVYAVSGNFTIAGAVGTKSTGTTWANPSDARVKTIAGDYMAGLAEVLQLTPRRFTYKGNETIGEPGADWTNPDAPRDDSTEAQTVPYPDSPHYQLAVDGTECVGLIAQEAEVAMPDLVSQQTMYVDGAPIHDFRVLDASNVTYALINAVKELTARIEALEAT